VRNVDEAYWDDYRGTPKAFIALAAGRELWRNRWGELTAIRVAPAPDDGSGDGGVAELADHLRRELVERIPLDAFGLTFRPVKQLGLGASGGATDFGYLFLAMSFFLIVSAAMLVALLFGLGVERRVAEVGLLRAVGYPEARVRRRLLAEGGLLAAVGSLVGLGGAVGYAALLMAGLRSWWQPAVGTSELYLHLVPTSLVIGFLASVAVVLAAVWWRVRKLRRVPTPALLARVSEPPDTRPGRAARITAAVALGLAAALVLLAFATGETENPAIFGTAGPAFLIGFLALFSLRLGGLGGGLGEPGRSRGALFRLALGNSGRNRGRSLLSTTLVASASFLIVTVAAYQSDFTRAELGRDSGTGGFELVAESDVPLLHRLDDADGRFELGVSGDAEELLAASEVVSMPLRPGDDTSCLNLYQPQQPRILGVPPELVERGGFTFQKSVEKVENPWTLLDRDLGPGVIPAIGDFNSTQWILKLPVGGELVLEDGRGEEIRLRLVAALATSIFQSELLIPEEQFRRHFPDRDGWSYFLVSPGSEAGDRATEEVARSLEGGLEDYGFDAVDAASKLESFHAVRNTYLSTFRTLGGLGLLLGTFGLAIVLLRNVIERRGELAALRAFGYRRSTLTRMVVVENAFLLLAGLVIGTVAALVTAAPHLLSAAAAVPWGTMAGTLAAIFLFGLLACTLAAAGAGRIPLLPALKAEG
jgi:ABC-type lipoprotein release transport system permease subunit